MTGKIDTPREPRVRFSLAAMIAAITVSGMILGVLRMLGPLAAIMATLLITAIAAHIAASYLGHRLGMGRKRLPPPHDRHRDDQGAPPKPKPKPKPCRAPQLAERSPLAVWQVRTIAQVSILGAALGAVFSARLPSEEFNYAVLAVSTLSGAAFGGMSSLPLIRFAEHAWRSIRAASADV